MVAMTGQRDFFALRSADGFTLLWHPSSLYSLPIPRRHPFSFIAINIFCFKSNRDNILSSHIRFLRYAIFSFYIGGNVSFLPSHLLIASIKASFNLMKASLSTPFDILISLPTKSFNLSKQGTSALYLSPTSCRS